jgi:hypothetical protein
MEKIGMKWWLAPAAALLLAACGEKPELNAEQLARIQHIAVYSAVGNELNVKDIPLMGWGTTDDFGSIAEFKLDDYIVAKFTEKLKDKYKVVPVKTPPQISVGDKTDTWYHNENYVKVSLPAGGDVGGGARADTFILVVPGTGYPFREGHQAHGAFLAHHPSMATVETEVGIAYDLVVMDAATGKEVKRLAVPVGVAVDDANWQEKFADLTPAQKKVINARLRELIDSTAERLLVILKLAD